MINVLRAKINAHHRIRRCSINVLCVNISNLLLVFSKFEVDDRPLVTNWIVSAEGERDVCAVLLFIFGCFQADESIFSDCLHSFIVVLAVLLLWHSRRTRKRNEWKNLVEWKQEEAIWIDYNGCQYQSLQKKKKRMTTRLQDDENKQLFFSICIDILNR